MRRQGAWVINRNISVELKYLLYWLRSNYWLFIAGLVGILIIYLLLQMDLGVDEELELITLKGEVTRVGLVDGSKTSNPGFYIYVSVPEYKHPVMVRMPELFTAMKGKYVSIICKKYESGRKRCFFDKYTDSP